MTAVLAPEASLVDARGYQAALAAGLFSLGVFLPWSTAGTSLSLGALLLLYCVGGRRNFNATPWQEPLVVVGLLLLACIGLRSATADGWNAQALGIANHYHELLVIPLMWGLMRGAGRNNAFLYGLLLGALGLAAAHWLPLPPRVENGLALRRISVGFGLSVCAFMLYEEGRLRRLPRVPAYAVAAFLSCTVLLAVGARTGYVVWLLLAICAGWRTAPRRWRWPLLAGIVVAAVVAFMLLSTVRERRGDIANSNKIRTELAQNTVEVVRRHWLVGTGWIGYRKAYAEVAASNGAPAGAYWANTDNPHNEYLMQAAGGGLPALGLFLAWLALPIAAPLRRREGTDSQTGVLACVALAFALGCMFNSLLLDFSEGHLYAALFAWLMAQRE